jgi:hypothetical protein
MILGIRFENRSKVEVVDPLFQSIGIHKFSKKFLYWGLERGFPFPV